MSISRGPWSAADTRPRRIEPFQPFSPAKWQGVTPPPYDWMVDGCFLRGTVSMLSGDGGLGKSLLMQQLLTAAAVGAQWLGLKTERVKGFGFFCEDDEDELHRRQDRINRAYGIDQADLDGVLYISRAGQENVLMEFNRRTDEPMPTPLFEQLRQAVLDHGAQILVLDTLADVFAGNEIIRNQVRRFISALRKLAMEMQGAVILTAHPSNAGLTTGSGISGSTAWNNSVRSRLYLTRSKPISEDKEEDSNERLLKTMKNNQGPYGGNIKLRWEAGTFVRVMEEGGASNIVDRIECDRAILSGARHLVQSGTMLAADINARNALVNVVRKLPSCARYSFSAVRSAQDRLMANGKLVSVEMGPPSKRRVYLRPADMRYPGEMGGETA